MSDSGSPYGQPPRDPRDPRSSDEPGAPTHYPQYPQQPSRPGPPPYSHPYASPVPYGAQPPSTGLRTGLIIVAVVVTVMIVACAGVITLVTVGTSNISDTIDEQRNRPGGIENPLPVTVGESFEIDEIEYADGWQVANVPGQERAEITGLFATNTGDEPERLSITVQFAEQGDVLGEISCSSEASIRTGQRVRLRCSSATAAAGDLLRSDETTVTAPY